MKNARLWLWGLVPLLALWIVALNVTSPKIANDLKARLSAALSAQGHGWVKAEVAGRDVHIASTAPNAQAKSTAIAIAQAVPGVRIVSGDVDILPTQSPYTWRAERKNSSLAVNGYTPDEAARTKIAEDAARLFQGAKIESRMDIANGAPEGFVGIVTYALELLSRLAEGEATLTDKTLAISGRAFSVASYQDFIERMKALPKGVTISSANIIPPLVSPYAWSAEKNAGGIILNGYAPDRQTREANVALAKAKLAGLALSDHQVLASGQSGLYARAVQTIIDALAGLKSGRGVLSGETLTLSGEALDAAAFAALADLFKAAGSDLKIANNVTPPVVSAPLLPEPPVPPALAPELIRPEAAKPAPSSVNVQTPAPATLSAEECGAKVRAAIQGRAIYFDTSMRFIRNESAPLIKALADAVKSCGKASIAVEGHTDGDGGAKYNQKLSENRALEVVRALKGAGARDANLSSVGFGEAKPVASNATGDGKAKNRRVELVIR